MIAEVLELLSEGVCEPPPAVYVSSFPKRGPLEVPVPGGWPIVECSSATEMVDLALESLAVRTTVVAPFWTHSLGGDIDNGPEWIIESLLEGAGNFLIVVLPAVWLSSRRGQKFREVASRNFDVDTIISFKGEMGQIHPSTPVAILRMVPAGRSDPVTRFFRIPPRGQEVEAKALDDLSRLLRRKGGEQKYGFVLRRKLGGAESWGHRDHDPQVERHVAQLADFGETKRIDELFEVIVSRARASDKDSTLRSGWRVIAPRDIGEENKLLSLDEESFYVADGGDAMLRVGDLVVRQLYDARSVRGLRWARIEKSDLPAVLGPHVIALRPRENMPRVIDDFVLRFLGSRHMVQSALGQEVGSLLRLTRTSFGAIRVPVPDSDLRSALLAIQDASDQARAWSEEATRLLESTFDDDTAAESRIRLIRESRIVRWRVQSGRDADDLSEQVRRKFPYPIAYRWRLADALLSGKPSRESYLAVLDAAEQLLAYLANVALALAWGSGIEIRSIESIRRNLDSGRGPGMGDWIAVLNEFGGRSFSDIDKKIGTPDFRNYCLDESAIRARSNLSKRRNDEAHGRRVEYGDLLEQSMEAKEELLLLLQGARFLIDLPLLLIKSTSWDTLSGKAHLQFQNLAGDHPVVREGRMLAGTPAIESGSLYLRGLDGALHLLRPFLIAQNCPQCHNLSIFHVDRWGEGEAVLKSIENGHLLHVTGDSASALRTVGLVS